MGHAQQQHPSAMEPEDYVEFAARADLELADLRGGDLANRRHPLAAGIAGAEVHAAVEHPGTDRERLALRGVGRRSALQGFFLEKTPVVL